MPATLAALRLDDATWASGSEERRREWRVALDEILETHRFDLPHARLSLLVEYRDGDAYFEATSVDGAPLARVHVARERLAAHLDEYLQICREMGRVGATAPAPRIEALDIAKRIAHDEAAEALQELCRPLRPDHATCRRLFTLLVTLHYDTTRLVIPHHRR